MRKPVPDRIRLLLVSILIPPAMLLGWQPADASVSGLVQDPTGALIGGTNCSVRVESTTNGWRQEVHTDNQGSFRLSGLRPGTYILEIRVLGFDPAKFKLELLAGDERTLPPIRLSVGSSGCFSTNRDPDGSRFVVAGASAGGFAGIVRTSAGAIAGAGAALRRCEASGVCNQEPRIAVTDAQGGFSFENLVPGRYHLRIERNGYLALTEGFAVIGGLENSYTFNLTSCETGHCEPDWRNMRLVACE